VASVSRDIGVKLSAIKKYPFERFSEDAKLTLVRAQEEAERMGVGYIGTEHILLGLLRVESGTAFNVLRRFDVSLDRVRNTVNAVTRKRTGGRVIPTSRVKRVVEISFDEATRMGHERVDTGHLLMGVVIEGEGIAAVLLADLGATSLRVVAEVERELGAPPSGKGTADKPDTRGPSPSIRGGERHDPPPKVHALREKLASVRVILSHAVAARDTEHALRLGSEEDRLEQELDKAEREWLDSLG
jgi:ATP-dependent Clp protease ATP-binding subunit ClpC